MKEGSVGGTREHRKHMIPRSRKVGEPEELSDSEPGHWSSRITSKDFL